MRNEYKRMVFLHCTNAVSYGGLYILNLKQYFDRAVQHNNYVIKIQNQEFILPELDEKNKPRSFVTIGQSPTAYMPLLGQTQHCMAKKAVIMLQDSMSNQIGVSIEVEFEEFGFESGGQLFASASGQDLYNGKYGLTLNIMYRNQGVGKEVVAKDLFSFSRFDKFAGVQDI